MLYLTTVGAVAVALVLFQTTTLVIGGHILKQFLDGFYQAFPEWWQRMLIVIIPLSGIGNLFAAYAFQQPFVAGVAFLVLGMWTPLAAAAVIDGRLPDPTALALMAVITILAIALGVRLGAAQ